jgi:hypothetical protein
MRKSLVLILGLTSGVLFLSGSASGVGSTPVAESQVSLLRYPACCNIQPRPAFCQLSCPD